MIHQMTYRIQEQNVPVQFHWNPRVKRMRMKFDARGNVLKLSAPRGTPHQDMQDFLKDSEKWILKQVSVETSGIPFENDVTVPILGKDYRIVHKGNGSPLNIKILEDSIGVYGPEFRINDMMCTFLSRYATSEFTKICEGYASRIGNCVNKVTIRDPKSRWGSCSSEGNISLSWRLLLAPREFSEYVCAHEVAHLREMNHSAAFWEIVGSIHPNYKELRGWLKKNGKGLFRYGSI